MVVEQKKKEEKKVKGLERLNNAFKLVSCV
jgi:hypothetical protein